jgi:O-Antigen ligase
MNIQRLPEHIIRWAVILGGIGLGLYSVKLAGAGSYGRIALIYALLGYVALTLVVGPRIWVAIPFAWALSGQIPALDVPFTVRDLVVMLVFSSCLVFKAFKLFRKNPDFDWRDAALLVMVLYIATCWIRNPVGVDALGSDRVGGRPYFNVFIGCLAYWVLARSTLHSKNVAMTGGRMFEGVAAQLLAWFPSLVSIVASYYVCGFFTWVQTPDSITTTPGAESTSRLGYLAAIGQPLALLLAATYWPLQLLNPMRFWRTALLAIALVCILLSGFRSVMMGILVVFAFSAYYWRGKAEIWKMASIGGIALAILLVSHGTFFELPRSAQRALSFLPGRWDAYARLEAQESTRWRVEMWKEMLTTDRYIDSHLFGDGFGFKKRDLELMIYYKKFGDVSSGQESFMISGNVHSGPVSAIRYVGYVGFGLFLTTIVGLSILAWRILWRARHTPFRILGFLICAPIVLEPFMFCFVFGAFENGILDALFGLGMLRMLGNSLNAYDEEQKGASKLPIQSAIPSAMPALNTPLPADTRALGHD